jgi:hypothetical protein
MRAELGRDFRAGNRRLPPAPRRQTGTGAPQQRLTLKKSYFYPRLGFP